ncbi:MAG: zinc-binding dehydrogenase [bacterium]
MKAVQLPQYNKNVLRALLSLHVAEIPMPEPGPDEVVVKLHAATCNPSDIAFIRGVYNIIKPIPAIPGFEASGIVVKTGEHCSSLGGKMVSCFVQSEHSGTWSEFFLANREDLIVLGEGFDMDQAAAFSVNPFTAWGMMEIAKMRESRAIVQNASGGQVAAFIRKLAGQAGIRVIDIVRKSEMAEELAKEKATVLCETDEDFQEQLTTLANEWNATTAFDAVGSTLSGIMLNALPEDSELVVYGGLSGKQLADFSGMDIIFRKKIISGFNLIDWKKEYDKDAFEEIVKEVEKLFRKGELSTRFQGSTVIDNITTGLKTYISNMSSGKLLIRPGA